MSDDLPEIMDNCNRILIIKQGKLYREVNSKEITEKILSDMITSEVEAE